MGLLFLTHFDFLSKSPVVFLNAMLKSSRQVLTKFISASVTLQGAQCTGISIEDQEDVRVLFTVVDLCRQSSEKTLSREELSLFIIK